MRGPRDHITPVLVVGVPRCGSTWTAKVLAQGISARYLEEPDNHFRFGYAFRAKLTLGRGQHPALEPAEATAEAGDYGRLWRDAFDDVQSGGSGSLRNRVADRLVSRAGVARVSAALGGAPVGSALAAARRVAVPRTAAGDGPLLVKSVYAALAVEWIAANHDVEVVVVARGPLNILSSWLELGWLEEPYPEPVTTLDPAAASALSERYGPMPRGGSAVGRSAWLIGVLACALDDAVARNPSWHRVEHEDMCRAPTEGYRSLAAALGRPWSAAADRVLEAWNRPGKGYETHRIAAELPDAWKSRLREADVEEAVAALEALSGSGS